MSSCAYAAALVQPLHPRIAKGTVPEGAFLLDCVK